MFCDVLVVLNPVCITYRYSINNEKLPQIKLVYVEFRKYFSTNLVLLLDRAVPIRNPFLNARIPRPSPTAIGPKKRASVRWQRKHRNTRENCKIFLMVRLWNVTGAGAPTDRFYTENLAPSGQDPPSLPTTFGWWDFPRLSLSHSIHLLNTCDSPFDFPDAFICWDFQIPVFV